MKLNTSIRKRFRVSNKVKKVASKDRFRLSISRSSKNISAQIIDDTKKVTLLSASSVEKDLRDIPSIILDKVKINAVKFVDEVFTIALKSKPIKSKSKETKTAPEKNKLENISKNLQ